MSADSAAFGAKMICRGTGTNDAASGNHSEIAERKNTANISTRAAIDASNTGTSLSGDATAEAKAAIAIASETASKSSRATASTSTPSASKIFYEREPRRERTSLNSNLSVSIKERREAVSETERPKMRGQVYLSDASYALVLQQHRSLPKVLEARIARSVSIAPFPQTVYGLALKVRHSKLFPFMRAELQT